MFIVGKSNKIEKLHSTYLMNSIHDEFISFLKEKSISSKLKEPD